MMGGILEQNRALRAVMKECREASGMAKITGYSLLSPNPKRGAKQKKHPNLNDIAHGTRVLF